MLYRNNNDIKTAEEEDTQLRTTVSIRECLILFVLKIATILIVTDTIYALLNCSEKIYDLDIIRSVSIDQSWLGKIFKYGTMNIEISASGGYTDQITLFGVANPQKYENMLRKHF